MLWLCTNLWLGLIRFYCIPALLDTGVQSNLTPGIPQENRTGAATECTCINSQSTANCTQIAIYNTLTAE